MSPDDHKAALTVDCGLCKQAAGSECVNSVDKVSAREPHNSRMVRGLRLAFESATLDFDLPPNAGSAS